MIEKHNAGCLIPRGIAFSSRMGELKDQLRQVSKSLRSIAENDLAYELEMLADDIEGTLALHPNSEWCVCS